MGEEARVDAAAGLLVQGVADVVDDLGGGVGPRFPGHKLGIRKFGRQATGQALQHPVIDRPNDLQ
jgi:hypothetical protein